MITEKKKTFIYVWFTLRKYLCHERSKPMRVYLNIWIYLVYILKNENW